MTVKYDYAERIIDLDAVTEMLYEQGNLAEEVFRAIGGDALPFYGMLGEDGLSARLRDAAKTYLEAVAAALTSGEATVRRRDDVAPARPLRIERFQDGGKGPRRWWRDATA